MAAGAVAQQEAVSRLYETHIEAARREYNDHYDAYNKIPEAIDKLTPVWTERHGKLKRRSADAPADVQVDEFTKTKEELDVEYWGKIDIYIGFQAKRNDAERILNVYDAAMAYCKRPILDKATQTVYENLGLVTQEHAGVVFEKIFTTGLQQLKDQRAKMQAVYDRIFSSLRKLRYALEPLGKLTSDYQGVSRPFGTPYVNADVLSRKEQLEKQQAPNAQLKPA